MSIIYTDTVGYKFHEDGRAKRFLGATIVSHLTTSSQLFKEVEALSTKVQSMSYARKFSFLPPSSYHMTNFVLYNDNEKDRNSIGWSTKIPRDEPCDAINAYLSEMLSTVYFPTQYRMRLTNIRDNSLRLVPANKESMQALKKFRDDCAEATGIRFPDHETYEFHITYAYRIIELDNIEKQQLHTLLTSETERIKENLLEFDIPHPEYCSFNDMTHFEPYKKRNNLKD